MAYTKQRIQLRRDTEAAWLAANPTLLPGEFAFDSTNKWIKVGVGNTWSETPYVRISADFVDGLEDKNNNTIYCLSNVTDSGFDFMSADGTAIDPEWTKLTGFTAKDWTSDIADAKAEAIAEAALSVNAETARAKAAEEANAAAIAAEAARARTAEEANAAAIATETARAEEAELEIKESIATVEESVESLGTRMDAAEIAIGDLDDNKADKAELTAYIPLSAANQDVTDENKVATMADVAGLSGVIHFRGAFENEESETGITDKQAFINEFAPVVAGDIAINTANSKEYLAIAGDAETPATADDIRELGDEGIYATKAELEAAIAALSAEEVTLDPSETVASVKEENGIMTVTKQAIQIEMDQVTDLEQSITDAIDAAKDYADSQDEIVSAATKSEVEAELIGTSTDISSANTIYGAKAYAKDYADAAADAAKVYIDGVSEALSATVAETYLSASEVEGKVALSTLAEVEAALTGFIKDVKVAGTSVVENYVANLGAMAGKDAVGEADLSGWFTFDCGGAVLPSEA